MNNVMKAMIVLVVISFSLGAIDGCKGKQDAIAGRYHNQDDFDEYIELKADGTAYWREKSLSLFGSQYTELAAKWKVEGEEIVFVGPLEVVVRGKISGNTILADGKVWVRKGEIKNTSEKSLKDRIPGKYISEQERVKTTKANLRLLHSAVTEFKMDTGRFPTEEEGLMALIEQPRNVDNWLLGGYLEPKEIPKDGWGNDFIYVVYPESRKPFAIKSLGADGQIGGQGYDGDLLSTDAY